ncbi:MAG: cytochrome c5 family protein [Burkholderiaceae bacterium]|jgi:cytochrome c5|nr:cytochrome c5 family protein [Burkholderiaceae bacterium]
MRVWMIGLVTACAATSAAGKGGQEVYESTCAACHATGVAAAPKFGDKAQWATRAAAGRDALAASVIKGKGAMPPRGGDPKLSDSDIRNAVDYLLKAAR